MLLFQKRFHQGLVDGSVRLTFRRWRSGRVRVGGRYRCHPIGVLEIDAVEQVRAADITEHDAVLCGFGSRNDLMDYLRAGRADHLDEDTELFRIDLHHGGDGDRVAIALDASLGKEDVDTITHTLRRMDAKRPWTRKTLGLIEKHPRVAASKLAAKLGCETAPFKTDVRKLKRLGLTQSFEVGYELSPRGRAYLAAVRRRRR